MPADFQRLSRLLSLSAENRVITNIGNAATDFTTDGGITYVDDALVRIGSDGDGVSVLNSAGLAINTPLTNVLIGTPVTPVAIAANSVIKSNVTASGDYLIAVNKAGTSHMAFMADGSTGDTIVQASTGQSIDIYIAGVKEIDYATGVLAFQQATTISTTATTLTLSPATDVSIANGKGLIVGGATQVTIYAPAAAADSIPEVQVLGTDASHTDSTVLIANFRLSYDNSPILAFLRSYSGTIGSFGIVENTRLLGSIIWFADDGTDYRTSAAMIHTAVDGTPGADDMPTRMVFSVTADGANGATEALRINNTRSITTLAALPSNITAAGAIIAGGGVAFSDVANAWIDDATHGNGTVTHYIGNNTIDVTVSSRTWKENILAVNGAVRHYLETFAGLLREYDYKDGSGHFVGMIAEDVREVLPQYVVGASTPSLKYNYMVGPLLWGWWDHEARIAKVERQLMAAGIVPEE